MTIHEILHELASAATDHRDKGDKFERLISNYLRTDPLYETKYSEVWLWNDWPGRDGKADTGIDLVVRERDSGEYCAVQCKFYSENAPIEKQHIDSFFTASGKRPFTSPPPDFYGSAGSRVPNSSQAKSEK
jgi:predicted helicase